MASIDQRLQQVKERIARACAHAGRDVQSVTLLAVSKGQPAQAVREAYAAGLRDFGENYVQEALEKMNATADLRADLRWHLIGPLQSNKTRVVAQHFDWVHTVDRLRVAQRLSEQRPSTLAPLQICLQVNIDGEPSKAGLDPRAVALLMSEVIALPGVRLRGLMSIPAPRASFEAQRQSHLALARLLGQLAGGAESLDTLSMGMSVDLDAAVAAGATMVRVGTALFGPR
jgi:PLP dependent protein